MHNITVSSAYMLTYLRKPQHRANSNATEKLHFTNIYLRIQYTLSFLCISFV